MLSEDQRGSRLRSQQAQGGARAVVRFKAVGLEDLKLPERLTLEAIASLS